MAMMEDFIHQPQKRHRHIAGSHGNQKVSKVSVIVLAINFSTSLAFIVTRWNPLFRTIIEKRWKLSSTKHLVSSWNYFTVSFYLFNKRLIVNDSSGHITFFIKEQERNIWWYSSPGVCFLQKFFDLIFNTSLPCKRKMMKRETRGFTPFLQLKWMVSKLLLGDSIT